MCLSHKMGATVVIFFTDNEPNQRVIDSIFTTANFYRKRWQTNKWNSLKRSAPNLPPWKSARAPLPRTRLRVHQLVVIFSRRCGERVLSERRERLKIGPRRCSSCCCCCWRQAVPGHPFARLSPMTASTLTPPPSSSSRTSAARRLEDLLPLKLYAWAPPKEAEHSFSFCFVFSTLTLFQSSVCTLKWFSSFQSLTVICGETETNWSYLFVFAFSRRSLKKNLPRNAPSCCHVIGRSTVCSSQASKGPIFANFS